MIKQFACVCVSTETGAWRHAKTEDVVTGVLEARSLAQNLRRRFKLAYSGTRVAVKQLSDDTLETAIRALISLQRLDDANKIIDRKLAQRGYHGK